MLAWVSATGATVAERSSSARQKPPKLVLGATIVRSTGWLFSTSSRRDAERVVDLRAAAGEGVAEADLVALDRLPGLLVEHVEELVDVDRFGVRR